MKIFLSWSGDRSKEVALILSDWLPDVLQHADTWMSDHIDAGSRWSSALAQILEECNVGLIILTPENQNAPWILYEAGALSKSVDSSRVIPFLVGMEPTDIAPPISQFQCVTSTKEGIQKLLASINSASPSQLSEERIEKLADKWWPDLASELEKVELIIKKNIQLPTRSDREVINEVLELVRGLARVSPDITIASKRATKIELRIDTRPIFGDIGRLEFIKVSTIAPAKTLLDAIWRILNDHKSMPPDTYGQKWSLKNERTGETFRNIASASSSRQTETARISHISELNLKDQDHLVVVAM